MALDLRCTLERDVDLARDGLRDLLMGLDWRTRTMPCMQKLKRASRRVWVGLREQDLNL